MICFKIIYLEGKEADGHVNETGWPWVANIETR